MNCKNCGQKLPDDYRFCDFCGAPQEAGGAAGEPVRDEAPVPVTAGETPPQGGETAPVGSFSGETPPQGGETAPVGSFSGETPPQGGETAPVGSFSGETPPQGGETAPVGSLSGETPPQGGETAPVGSLSGETPPQGGETAPVGSFSGETPPQGGLVWAETGLGYPDGGAAVLPRKKLRKWVFAVAGGALALLIVLGVLLWFALRGGDPKTIALNAISQTRSQLADERAQRQKLLSPGAAFEQLRERAVKQELELRVRELRDEDGQDMGILSGAGVRLELRQDFPNRRMRLDSHFGVGASDFLRLLLQFQDDEAAVNFPQADPNWYGFNTRTWARDYSRSGLAGSGSGSSSDDDDDGGFNVFDPPGDGQGEPLKFYDSDELASLGSALKGEITGRRMGLQETEVNGVPLRCELYELTIPQSAIRTYIRGICGSVRDSEGFQAGWKQYVNTFWGKNLDQYDSYGEGEQALNHRLDNWIDEMSGFFASDVTMNVYTHEGRAVKRELTGKGEANGSRKNYRLVLELGTETGALSDALRFRIETSDGGAFEFTAKGNSVPKDSPYTCDAKLALEDDSGETVSLVITCEYDPRGGDDNFHFQAGLLADDRSEILSLSMDGSVHTDQEQRSFDAKLDRIRLAASGGFELTLSGRYSIAPLDTQKEPIEAVPTVSLFDMTEPELYTLLEKLVDLFQNTVLGQL